MRRAVRADAHPRVRRALVVAAVGRVAARAARERRRRRTLPGVAAVERDAGEQALRAAVGPAILLPDRDQVAPLGRIGTHPRLDLGVAVQRARLRRSVAAGGERRGAGDPRSATRTARRAGRRCLPCRRSPRQRELRKTSHDASTHRGWPRAPRAARGGTPRRYSWRPRPSTRGHRAGTSFGTLLPRRRDHRQRRRFQRVRPRPDAPQTPRAASPARRRVRSPPPPGGEARTTPPPRVPQLWRASARVGPARCCRRRRSR